MRPIDHACSSVRSGTFIPKKVRSPIKAGEVVNPARFPAHLPTIFSIETGLPSSARPAEFPMAIREPESKRRSFRTAPIAVVSEP